MAEVSPELLSQIADYLKKRERGETSLLSFYFRQVFGRELKINCGGCIEDAVRWLKAKTIKSNTMEHYKWVGGDKVCNIRTEYGLVTVSKHTCTDTLAQLVSTISKYAHLVEAINGGLPPQKKSEPMITHITPIREEAKVSQPTLSILIEQPKDESKPKKKGKKQK